jgi:hypothetical protein
MNWSNFPETSPKERGYYFTYYFNKTLDKNFYKCLYWDIENKVWLYPNFEFSVDKFIEDTKSKHYTKCLSKISTHPKCDELCTDWI